MKFHRTFVEKKEKGQVLVIVALIIIVLVAIIGLAVDSGYMYVSYARLRRAVDAAALGATGEFKRPPSGQVSDMIIAMKAAAEQQLELNNVNAKDDDNNPATLSPYIKIESCDTLPAPKTDYVLCPELDPANSPPASPAKVVRVTVTEDVPTFFLAVIGMRSVPISVSTVSKAASVDVVLVLDSSKSMTYGHPYPSPLYDPAVCNASDPTASDGFKGDCKPFQDLKESAINFARGLLFFPYDRMGVVDFNQKAHMALELSPDQATIENAIQGLTVYEGLGRCPYSRDILANGGYPPSNPAPPTVADTDQTPYSPSDPPLGPCRFFDTDGGNFLYLDCPLAYGADPDPSHCGSSNVADGIALGGAILAGHYESVSPQPSPIPPVHDDALWVMVLLGDGSANAAYSYDNGTETVICPSYTWDYDYGNPYCQDKDAAVRHTDPANSLYDADDRARDMFDLVTNNHVLIFNIGLGTGVNNIPPGQTVAPGRALLQYPSISLNNGLYYFANNGSELGPIFLAIANKIATRLTQ